MSDNDLSMKSYKKDYFRLNEHYRKRSTKDLPGDKQQCTIGSK